MDDPRYPTSSTSQSVVQHLCRKIEGHSPEIVAQIADYLEQNGEPVDKRQSFDGTDASVKLCYALIEALLAYEQIHMELLAQQNVHTPSHLRIAQSIGMKLEPQLIFLSKEAFELHLALWNAHTLAARPKPELEPMTVSPGDDDTD